MSESEDTEKKRISMGFSKKIGILDPKGLESNPLTNKDYSDTYKKLATVWSAFPAYEKAKDVLETIKTHTLTFIISGTGSGKTVLIPKYALHYTGYQGKIAITLPKRNVTVSSASFAAKTLDVELGEQVGYIYRGSPPDMLGPENRMVYMTDGLLVSKFTRDPLLSEFQVIIIDEAHERKTQIDMILLFLKELLTSGKRPDLRVIIMSATIDGEKYQKYFKGVKSKIINISGQPNYEIETKFLDRSPASYIAEGSALIDSLLKDGLKQDLLFFITTSNEALQLCRGIRPKYPKVFCIEVYSEMDKSLRLYAESRDKFLELGNYDMKLIMATNVAESSITIDGLKYVVDSGFELYSYFEPESGSNVLERRMITQAQALQRRGRVGRTEPGVCYHLMTKLQFDHLQKYPEPDIMKQDITLELLKIISITSDKNYKSGMGILNQLMDVPKQKYIDYATDLYHMYNLIDKEGKITKAGLDVIQFSTLTVNRSLFLIYAYQLHCAKQACIILSMLDETGGKFQNLFYTKDTVKKSSNTNPSVIKSLTSKKGDHLTMLYLYNAFKEAPDQKAWSRKYNLRLEPFNRASNGAKKYYFRIINLSQAPKIDESNLRGGDQPTDEEIEERIMNALSMSHKHMLARKLTPTYPHQKQEGSINKASVLNMHYKKVELSKKTFIYDTYTNINGSFEFSGVSLIN